MGKRNTILVTLDSLRADFCGYVNEDRTDLTPTLTRLANEGIAYTEAIAPGPRTPSSVPTLFTGEFHQYRSDPAQRDWRYRHQRLNDHMARHDGIAEKLRTQGFNTAAVTMNPWTTTETGFDRGFDRFMDLDAMDADLFAERDALSMIDKFLRFSKLSERTPWNWQKYWFVHWEKVFPQIHRTLEELEEPYFLWIFLLDCHLPYVSPRRFRTQQGRFDMLSHIYRYSRWKFTDYELTPNGVNQLKRAYEDAVRSTDGFLERLVGETQNDATDPILVIHADHGEGLGDHGTFSHMKQLYEENIHVPLVIHNADIDCTVNRQVSLRSLPSLIRGISDGSNRFDPSSAAADWILSETEFAETVALRGFGYKSIQSQKRDELYDLRYDQSEQHSLDSAAPELVEGLRGLLANRLAGQREKANLWKAAKDLANREIKRPAAHST